MGKLSKVEESRRCAAGKTGSKRRRREVAKEAEPVKQELARPILDRESSRQLPGGQQEVDT